MCKRILSAIVIIALFSAVLGGCQDANEIDAVVRVLVIGIDKGVTDKWRLTVQFSSMKETPGGGGGEEGGSTGGGTGNGYSHVTIDAPSFFEGIDMLGSSISRKLFFTHAGTIIISERLAREGILGDFIAPLIRYKQIRESAQLYVVKGEAMDFIVENQPTIGNTLSKSLELAAKQPDNTGYTISVTLNDFYSALKSTHGQPIMAIAAVNDFKNFKRDGPRWKNEFKKGGEYKPEDLPRHGENKIEFWGTAVFNRDKMVDELTGGENRLLLMARNEFKRGFFTIRDPKSPDRIIAMDVLKDKNPKIKISFDEDGPVIDITIFLKGDILSIQSRIHYEEDPLLSTLVTALEKDIKDDLDRLINKCKNQGLDVFRFGESAAKYFATIEEWEKYYWNDKFKDAKINTKVDFSMRRTGTRLRSSPIPRLKGEE
ncbi:MAG: Ger(x)C family spore germination protein [Clostridiales bacterium]|nr:Ger(x)C family spore germination protein [Clostridiales bacterium]